VSDIERPSFESNVFHKLVLPENQKRLLLAAIEPYVFDNVVTLGSMVILLLGGPGVGKTISAIYAAELTKRPLHSISSGDLGGTSQDVESTLKMFLQRAQRWEALLLLEDADAVLETRIYQGRDVNTVLTVCVRALEMQRGIAFLTTNHVGQLDEAIRSRIHLSIEYPNLQEETRMTLWDKLFEDNKDTLGEDVRIHLDNLSSL
jgi:AAA+ superfamily predicted ATPase